MSFACDTWSRLLLAVMLGVGSGIVGCQTEHPAAVHERVLLQPPRQITLPAGQAADAVIGVVVSEGFHVQANPVSFDYLIPTRLEMKIAEEIEIGRSVYPPGKSYLLPGSPTPLSVYDGTFEIIQPLYVPVSTPPGHYHLQGTLHYQLCDHRMCFRPLEKPVIFSVHVLEPDTTASNS